MLAVSPGCSRWRCCARRMPPGARGERRGPVAGMGMPGTGRRDQLPGAGARAAARPNRPISASMSASARPCQVIAASAHAMTRASASPSGDPVGPGGQGSRPSRVSMTATRRPNSDVASCSICPARARRRRSQPRTVAAGTPSSAPSRGRPRAVQRRRGGRPRNHPDGVCPPGNGPRRQQDVRRTARAAPSPSGPQPAVPAAVHPDRPLPPVAPRPQPPGPA